MSGSSELSKTQIDRLGDRLRKGDVHEDDLHLLNRYRRSFIEPYEAVVKAIKDELKLEPTGRTPKTRTSILDKLRRQRVRLSQMQDIAGCRIIVQDLESQDEVVERLKELFDRVIIDDRREHPSNGYRAVHVIVGQSGKHVEIQVRTARQDEWAQFSERFSDDVDPAIKYGGGDSEVVALLAITSKEIMNLELAIRKKDFDGMTINHERVLNSFDRLSEVSRRAKGLKDDFSN